ncbi:MAG: hypothetical protein PHC88_05660 [Terrimicrobiaceae bacterium]|nr:hypothetical protein [Terrimicrobiaceae bacterium]
MPNDVTVDSSTTPEISAADVFYKDAPETTPEADSTTATETHSEAAAPVKDASQTESDSEPETTEESEARTERERGTDGKFKRSDAGSRIKQLLSEKKQLEAQLAQRETKPVAAKPNGEALPIAEPAPEPGQFQTWDEYRKAEAAYTQKQIDAKVREGIARDREEQTAKAAADKQKAEGEAAYKEWTEKIEDSRKLHPDFDARVFDDNGNVRGDIPLHAVFDAFIPRSKVGAEVLYYLAGHLDEAKAIAKMQPLEASGEFHRIQSEILAAQTPLKTKSRPPSLVSGNARPNRELSTEEVFYGKN